MSELKPGGFCVYCGHEDRYETVEERDSTAGRERMLDHLLACDKRPERKLIDGMIVLTTALQQFYDVTTWLLSTSPTGRIDLGASQAYHDALQAMTTLREELRTTEIVKHDESWWQRHLKNDVAQSDSTSKA